MDLRILNYVTVLLFVLNLTGLTQLSWWLVFLPSAIWLAIFILVLIITLTIMIANNMTIAEFNKLMEDNKKNK